MPVRAEGNAGKGVVGGHGAVLPCSQPTAWEGHVKVTGKGPWEGVGYYMPGIELSVTGLCVALQPRLGGGMGLHSWPGVSCRVREGGSGVSWAVPWKGCPCRCVVWGNAAGMGNGPGVVCVNPRGSPGNNVMGLVQWQGNGELMVEAHVVCSGVKFCVLQVCNNKCKR